MLPLHLQHEDDEIETLLSEHSDAIDPSLWETSVPTSSAKDERYSTRKEQPRSSSRSSYCFCVIWLGISIFVGIFLTIATDHRDEISKALPSFWKNDNTDKEFSVLDDSSATAVPTIWNSFNDTIIYHQQNVSVMPLDGKSHGVTDIDTTHNDLKDLEQDVPLAAAKGSNSSKLDVPLLSLERDDDDEDLPHVWNDNLQFRRVCANVHESTLCLTIRYPFEVPLQDPSVSFPEPVDERFYQLNDLIIIDGPTLEQTCRNPQLQHANNSSHTATTSQSMSGRILDCLEHVAGQYPNNDTVVAVFTRSKDNGGPEKAGEEFYGTYMAVQRRRMVEFFRGHVMLVLGASPTPYVSHCLKDLFDKCTKANKGGGYNCLTEIDSQHNRRRGERLQRWHLRRLQVKQPPSLTEQVWIRVVGYYPFDNRGEPSHAVNRTLPLMEVLWREHSFTAGLISNGTAINSEHLRPLSILVEFPIAHAQTETMITDYSDQVRYNQLELTHKILNLTTSREAQDQLAGLGLKLAHIIAFDGLPQHFPTKTGGYTQESQNLIGTTCMGPLPHNSPLRRVNAWERLAFEQYGLDMSKFYAKTWEFANQFWWQETLVSKKNSGALDCTHPKKMGAGMSMVHKYFVQAMVDGYYESQARRQE